MESTSAASNAITVSLEEIMRKLPEKYKHNAYEGTLEGVSGVFVYGDDGYLRGFLNDARSKFHGVIKGPKPEIGVLLKNGNIADPNGNPTLYNNPVQYLLETVQPVKEPQYHINYLLQKPQQSTTTVDHYSTKLDELLNSIPPEEWHNVVLGSLQGIPGAFVFDNEGYFRGFLNDNTTELGGLIQGPLGTAGILLKDGTIQELNGKPSSYKDPVKYLLDTVKPVREFRFHINHIMSRQTHQHQQTETPLPK